MLSRPRRAASQGTPGVSSASQDTSALSLAMGPAGLVAAIAALLIAFPYYVGWLV